MKLSVKKRQTDRKSEATKMRQKGDIPAVLYGKGIENENLQVSGEEFAAALRQMSKGHLPTTVFTLEGEDGQGRKALVKDIQYHRTTYNILHIDLELLQDNVPVNVNVPIEFVGMANCAGIKVGGVLRKVIRRLRVSCLPKDLPSFFEIDVRELVLKGTKRLNAITLPEGVRPLQDLNEVAVVIAKR